MSLSVSEGERVACHLCKKLFKVEDICYHVDVCEEDQLKFAQANPVPSAPPAETSACPICNKLVEKHKLEEHVNHCLDAKPLEPNPEVEAPKNNLIDEDNPFLKQQQEYLNYFARLKINPNLPNPNQVNPRPEVDLQVALEMQRKEQEELEKIRKLREQDEELAKKIWEEEQQREERIKKEQEERAKQRELQKTVELAKKEALIESDAKIAKMMAEKEELERKLEDLERERRLKINNNNPVSVSVDDLDLPEYWAIHPHGVDHLSVDVTEEDDDYHHVTSAFLRDMPHARILRVERNQNIKLWTWYSLKKKFMQAESNPNEQFLFHGSRVNAYDTILKEGFDHRVANLQGAYGAGCYFGANAKTSNGFVSPAHMGFNHHFAHHVAMPSYKRQRRHVNQWGHNFYADEHKLAHKMMYCRVLLGKVGPGSQGLRRPPEIPGQRKRYDSVGNQTMSVIFDNADRKSVV